MMDSILWSRLDLPGHEIGRVVLRDDRWELSGTAVFAHDGQPCKMDYVVLCDSGWRTGSAHISGWVGKREIDLFVSVEANQRWLLNGVECSAISGCIDIDLGFSPSTNLLPIRRLSLKVGDEAQVKAAWLPFPSLEPEVLPQMYRREGERTYRYESRGGSFVRTLEVNSSGFVTSYPGLWRVSETVESSAPPLRKKLSPAIPILRVEDLDASVTYYVERLGFQLQWRSDPLASVGRDSTSIMLAEGDQGQPGTWVWIAASDVDELYGEFEARGARLRHPPANYPWGSRECQVTDPDGHVLRFGAESAPGDPLGDWLDGEGRRWTPQPDGGWRAVE